MRVRKGDKVKVTTGKYKNTISTVLELSKKNDRVLVENVNVKKRSVKRSDSNNENYIFFPHSIHISNVRLVDDEGKYVKKNAEKSVKATKKPAIKKKSEKK